MTELKTDYKEDILETSQQGKRTFNIVSKTGEILFEDVHIEDVSKYTQVGDEYGQEIINEQNSFFNAMDDKLDELLEFMGNGIKATDVTYNNSNVKAALDTLVNKISNTKKYAGLVTSNLVVASNGTGTFTIGDTSYNSYEILYYGWSGCRQSIVVPSSANVNIPLLKSATEMAIVSISAPSNGVVTITNNSSQTITINRIYGINFQ